MRTGERLAALSALQELTEAASALFDPAVPVSDFLMRVAERTGATAAICVQASADGALRIVGAAGISRSSLQLPLQRCSGGWSSIVLPYPELGRQLEHRWVLPMNNAWALLLYFRVLPANPHILEGVLEQVVVSLENAFQFRRLCQRLMEQVKVRDDFLTVASHELKTPLTPLGLRLDILARDAHRGEPSEPQVAEKARTSLKRLSRLIEELLDFTRIHGGRLTWNRQRCALEPIIDEALASFEGTSPRHRLRFEVYERAVVQGDPSRLEQVITNLVENAIKYSPGGGEIRVALGSRGGEALISVADPGIGIPADQLNAVFDRFFRARNAPSRHYGGLGIGLYITRDIVQRLGGRVWVESEMGRGTTFWVALPLADTQEARAPNEQQLAGPPAP